MILKEIIKKNAMAVVAMVIAVGSLTVMSFGNNITSTLTEEWYAVESDGTITSTISPPNGTCLENVPDNVCAIYLPENHTFSNISQAPDAPKAGRPTPGS